MFSVIILAGGNGNRMKQAVPKQFLALAGKPIIMHTLERLETIDAVGEVIVVCHPQYIDLLRLNIEAYMLKKPYRIVQSGATRQQSTLNGLRAASKPHVVIHEAARPFVSAAEFRALMEEPCENAIYGIDIPFTVLLAQGGYINGLLEREKLLNVQLPQKFNKAKMLSAHEKAREDNLAFTEDASILYHYERCEIKILKGNHYNIKITEPVDLVSGEIIYKEYIVGRH